MKVIMIWLIEKSAFHWISILLVLFTIGLILECVRRGK